MADKKKIGVHGTAAETGADKVPGTKAAEEKKACPITKTQFTNEAPAAVQVANVVMTKKVFAPDKDGKSTLGYFAQVQVTIIVNGEPVKLNGNCQVYVANSKNAAD